MARSLRDLHRSLCWGNVGAGLCVRRTRELDGECGSSSFCPILALLTLVLCHMATKLCDEVVHLEASGGPLRGSASMSTIVAWQTRWSTGRSEVAMCVRPALCIRRVRFQMLTVHAGHV